MKRFEKKAIAANAFAACALVLLALAASAQAATSYRNVGSFGTGTISKEPFGLAVDSESGHVLVNGPTEFEATTGSVLVFDSSTSAAVIAEFGAGELAVPFSIAVDTADGAVYVADSSNQILRFTSDGNEPPTYSLDNTYEGPEFGTDPGQVGDFHSQMAIDPSNGDLLVADRGNQRISRYHADGSFVSSFDGADAPEGPFARLADIAVAPDGDVYSLESSTDFFGQVAAPSRIQRFSASGEALEPIGVGVADSAVSIAFDPTRQNLVAVSQPGAFSADPLQLIVFHEGELTERVAYPAETAHTAGMDLAFNGSTGRLYSTVGLILNGGFGGQESVQVFDPVVVAELTIAAPDQIAATSARFSGTVDPSGKPTSYQFEYSSDDGATWSSTAAADAGEGEVPVPVEATAEGLSPNTTYRVRLEAHNGEAGVISGVQAFTTSVAPPGTVTGATVQVTSDRATLRGSVNPFGLQASYHFEFGPTASYGGRVPLGHEAVAGQGRKPLQVEQFVDGLQPDTVYHYRLVAENSAGTSFGEDRTFTTSAANAGKRSFELVSETEKGGSEVDPLWAHAAPDGEWITFQTRTAIPGGISSAAPWFPRYIAQRGSTSWGVDGLDPPEIPNGATSNFWYSVFSISEDGTKAVVVSPKALAPGAGEGDSNLYLKDTASGTYQLIGTSAGEGFWFQSRTSDGSGSLTVLGGTPDFSKVVFKSEGFEFLPGVAANSIYEWSDAGLRVVAENSFTAATNFDREPHFVSEDGSTIFYWREASEIWAEVEGEDIHVSAENEATTAEEFVGASADGRYVFTQGNLNFLYRFDLETRELTTIADNLQQQSALLVSRDGGYVYYVNSSNTIAVWHDGEIDEVASTGGVPTQHYRASPSGRYFFFSSTVSPTGFESEGFEEFYRYDAVTEELVCASCRTDGAPPTGSASVGEGGALFENWIARSVLDNGEVFFDTPDPLLPADVNSSRDVYAFDGSQLTLISAGTGRGASQFADASEDGRDVFFTTQDQLVAKDTDRATDMYDARLGGGLAGQNPGSPQPPCEGEGCRGPAPPAPPPPPLGSEVQQGSIKKTHPRKKRCGKHVKAKKKSRCKANGKRNHGRNGR